MTKKNRTKSKPVPRPPTEPVGTPLRSEMRVFVKAPTAQVTPVDPGDAVVSAASIDAGPPTPPRPDVHELIYLRYQMIDECARPSYACPEGTIRELLIAIENGEVKTAAECKAKFGRFPTYFRGEVKRMNKNERAPEMLNLINSLTRSI